MSEGPGESGSLRRRPASEPTAAALSSPTNAPPVRVTGKPTRLRWLLGGVVLVVLLLVVLCSSWFGKTETQLEEAPIPEVLLEEEVFASACGLAVNASLVRRVFERAGKKCLEPLRTWVCSLANFDAPPVAVPQAGAGRKCRRPEGDWAHELEYRAVSDPQIRLGIVMLVHKWWLNVIRMLNRFTHYQMVIGKDRLDIETVVHVDAHSAQAYSELRNHSGRQGGVHILKMFKITRGGEAMLEASLDGIRRLVNGPRGPPDFTMLLSESHYIMRSPGQFYATLALHVPLSFVGIHRWFRRGGSLARFKNQTSNPDAEVELKRRIPMFECNGKVFVDESLPLPAALTSEPYIGGVQWVTLSRQLVSAAFRLKAGQQESLADAVLKQVRLFAQPDEAFFQTLLAAMSARDACDLTPQQVIGYSMTWSQPATYSGPDPDSEAEVTSPPLLKHFNDMPSTEETLFNAWSTPSLWLRKLDNNETRPFQDRLDFLIPAAYHQNIPWDVAKALLPMCAMLSDKKLAVKSGVPECTVARLDSNMAMASFMRYNRLMVRLKVKLDEKVRDLTPLMPPLAAYVRPRYINKEATFYLTEQWALRSPEQPVQPGLRVLALRVGRQIHSVTFRPRPVDIPELAPASVVWPAPGQLGLLAYLEVLPMSLHFEVEWQAPDKSKVRNKTAAHKHSWTLWSPCPLQDSLQEGRWRVALHLAPESPGGPQLLAWRDFLVKRKPQQSDFEDYFRLSYTPPVM